MHIKNVFGNGETEELRSLMTVYLKGVPRGREAGFPVPGGLAGQGIYLVVCSQRH